MLKDYPLEKDLLVEDIKNAKKFMEKNNIKWNLNFILIIILCLKKLSIWITKQKI